MRLLLDSFWRAAAYCLHLHVIMLSLLPLVLMTAMAVGLGYFFWGEAVAAVQSSFESWTFLDVLFSALDAMGAGRLRNVLAPLIVVLLATPVLVILALLVVA